MAAAAPQDPICGEAPFREFANSSQTSERLRRRSVPLLNSKELLRNFQALTQRDQTKFLDKVDQAYPTIDSSNAKFVITLGDVCSATERLPTSALLSAGLEKRGNIAVASGGFTDIWRGEYYAMQVSIKVFRIRSAQNLRGAKQILWGRIPTWRRLSHENILSFRGVTTTLFQLALVYDWGDKGNISQYIGSNPRASRTSLLLGVAEGLEYLHSLNIPHGDLKGENVVIDQNGCPRLTEYGLAPINSDSRFTAAAATRATWNLRCLAPEVIEPRRGDDGKPVMESKHADVFAFAILAFEVFAEEVPFPGQTPTVAALRVQKGERPKIPRNARQMGLTGEVWKLLESCWHQDPKRRPSMKKVVRRWRRFVSHENDRKTPPALDPSRSRAEDIQPIARPVKRRKKWFFGLF